MISIGNVVSAADGVRYFDEAVAESHVDYYAGRGEAAGVWRGPAASRLGLSGKVERDDLVCVLEGRDPRTGAELGRHHARQKNVAFDVTFSLPKSVSVLYALGDAEIRHAVLHAMDAGAVAAHEYLQRHAAWGRVFDRATRTVERVPAELVTASFVHRTARPVTRDDGRTTVDPQLHTHLVVASFVHRANGTWGQLYSEPLYAHAAAASAVGQAAVRDALVLDLGVRVRTNPNGTFELEGITEKQLAEFSQRHAQVLAAAAAAGATSMHGIKVAVLDTRQSKREIDPGTNLFAAWAERAADVGLSRDAVRGLCYQEQLRRLRLYDVSVAAEIVGRCENGLTATASVFTRRAVIRSLAAHAPLGMTLDGLEQAADAILGSDAVVPMLPPAEPGVSPSEAMRRWVERGMEVHYSTPDVVALERRMLESAQARVGEGIAVIDGRAVEAAIGTAAPLTDGQRSMVEAACTSPDGVLVVEGAAGVGKTTAARIVREVFVRDGRPVLGCAPSGRAVRGLETDAGIPSSTVASLLTRWRRSDDRLPQGSVVLVDECSMLGPDLAELVLLAHRDRVKLVLVGDSQQLQPIDGGALFRSLGDALGRVEVTEVLRQHEPWEREALSAFRAGDVAPLVGRYLEEGRVYESPTQSDRIAAMSVEWVAATTMGSDCICIARERLTVAELNAATRQVAVQTGLVAPHGEFRRCVEDVGRQRVGLGELEFAPGDRIVVVGRNDRSLGLVKGMRGTVVESWINGALVIEPTDAPGRRQIIPPAYDGVAHGYAMTAHRAQGITVDVSLVHGSDAADRQWQYVALSRHRMRCRYFDVAAERDVDGVHHGYRPDRTIKERLVEVMSRDSRKASTLDYPAEYERQLRLTHAVQGPEGGVHAGPTTEQLDALVRTGRRDRLPPAATWVHASVLLEPTTANRGRPKDDARLQLQGLGLTCTAAEDVVARATTEVDQRRRPGVRVPRGYGRDYRGPATREAEAATRKRLAARPHAPAGPPRGPSHDLSEELSRQQELDRRRRQDQLQRDYDRQQQERDRGPSMGMW